MNRLHEGSSYEEAPTPSQVQTINKFSRKVKRYRSWYFALFLKTKPNFLRGEIN